jgi:hypothetical protein
LRPSGAAGEHQRHDSQNERKRCHQDGAEAQAGRFESGLLDGHAPVLFRLGKLHDQNGVLGRQADQHDQADLHVDVVVEAHQPDPKESAQRH